MILLDANVLVYAFRRDSDRHVEYRAWLESALLNEAVVGVPQYILSSIVRITTHPRIFAKPSTLQQALEFCDSFLEQENVLVVAPGGRHWSIFKDIVCKAGAKGNLIADAYLAALAIEQSAEWITTDGDFARFTGLRWRHPLQ